MPHISRRKLNKNTQLKIHETLVKTVAKSSSLEKSNSLIEELLTPTEKIMLAKRLTIIILSMKGYSSYRISKILKVSHATVLRLSKNTSQYKSIEKLISRKSVLKQIEKEIDWIISTFPRKYGGRRWAFMDK
jgi:Trp operon repressor